jgi:3-oxoacyl-[acyl-carrier protein] reductase
MLMAAIDLSGKVALITGSSRGIGRAIAERLAEHGAAVVLNGRGDSERLRSFQQHLGERYGVRCEAAVADVGDAGAVSGMFRTVFGQFGRLDILVNNAGTLQDSLIGMISQDQIRETLNTNVIGTLNCIQAGARLLQRSGSGSIINMASIIGVRGNAGQLVYGASKGAVINATLSASKELAPKGIRVNAIAPGYIDTDMIRNVPAETHQALLAGIGMGRIGTAEDVADVALFLASSLSRYITGQVIGVDGGMSF